jgi:UDP-GlcNAc:undecaprenyl-phosphate GlcNAc-1-phosphate transferase
MLQSAALAFAGTVVLISILRRHASRYGLVDRPSNRKTHSGEIPVVGGIALGCAFLAAVYFSAPDSGAFLPFAAACMVILLTGLLDDLKEFSSRSKFAGQIVAALLMVSWAGVYVTDLGDLLGAGDIALGNWAIPFTVFGVVGIVNAMNMIDGVDGLAGGIGIVAAAWLLAAALIVDPGYSAPVLATFSTAIAGFLVFNLRHAWRRRASVFLGDTGSMLLGFVLAWFAVDFSRQHESDFYAISAVWILGLPIMDTLYLMGRRILRRQSPFQADRRHVHHTLVFMGLSETATSWVLIAMSAAFGAVGFFGWYFKLPEPALTYGFLATFAAYCVVMQKWKRVVKANGGRAKKPAPPTGSHAGGR